MTTRHLESLMRLILEPKVYTALAEDGEITIKFTDSEYLFEENQYEPGFVEAYNKEGKQIADYPFV